MPRTASRKNMDELGAHESRLYSDWAPLYDKTFAKFFYSRERTVIRDLNLPANAEILEVGVGTGTSLPAYPHNCHITGIDQAPLMLARAREKIAQNNWRHLEVREMDALNLTFSDNAFDYVVAFHVVSVVPDPVRMVNEMKRVCRPGGTIVVVNHFTTTSPIWGKLTKSLDPITRRLGWSTNLELKPFLEEAAFTAYKAYRYSRSSLYTVVVGTNDKDEGPPTHATESPTPSSPGAQQTT